MSKIQNESMRYVFLRSIPAVMMSATLLSIASTGCIDSPATATDESGSQTDLSVSDLRLSGLILPAQATAPTQSLASALDDLLDPHGARPAAATTNAVACSNPGWIHAFGTNLFVSARVDYTGIDYAMLRAAATRPDIWESFQLCRLDNGEFVIFSNANGRFVSAEFGYTGTDNAMLRARATQIGPWERFIIVPRGGYYTLQTSGNFLFVSAEFGYPGGDNGMLRARATAIGPWEKYTN